MRTVCSFRDHIAACIPYIVFVSDKEGIVMEMNRRSFVGGLAAMGAGVSVASIGANVTGQVAVAEAEEAEGMVVSGYQCSEDWLGEAPVIDEAEIVSTVEVDVVVCGAGVAGNQCALGAAQAGAKVAVLESQAKDDYYCFGDDIATYNSEFLTARGFGGYKLSGICAEFVRRGCGRVSPELIRQFVENSGEMLDNLVSVIPDTSNILDFDSGQCQVQVTYGKPDASYYPVVRGGFKGWASCLQTCGTRNLNPVDGRDPQDVTRLTEFGIYTRLAAEKLGATWYWETPAVVLEQNADGDVTGVIGKGPDGYVRFVAKKGVCLCTGDFSGNPDMVWNLLDDVNEIGARGSMTREEMCGSGRDGSGLKIGCWAGGFIESHPRPSMNTLMFGVPGPWGNPPFPLLNAYGERFMNEAMAGFQRSMVQRQPHGLVATVTDANYLETLKNVNVDHGCADWGEASVGILGFWDKMRQGMEEAAAAGAEGADVYGVAVPDMALYTRVYAADTLEELFDYLGYEGADKERALKTIEEYNEMCHNGVDEQFGKDPEMLQPIETPPFFGSIESNIGHNNAGLVTVAGLVTDNHMNVLKEDYTTPIKGLYAAGNCLGHRFGPGYSTPTAGASCGMAMTHGRVLGKYVAGL